MKTTLYNNTIESLQNDPDWKLFLDSIVDDCHVVNDDNLIAETENGLVLLSDSQDELRPRYASLSYKRDLMRLNVTENISLVSFLRMLSLYGARIREVNKNIALPHTYLVQSSDKDNGVWEFRTTNVTNDHKAQTPDPENQSTSIDVYASIPNQSENYFEEDTRYKYIYDVYGYNQKESVLYYSNMCYVRRFYKFTNSKYDNPNTLFYVEENDIADIYNTGGVWDIEFASENPRIWKDKGTQYNPYVEEGYTDMTDIINDPANKQLFEGKTFVEILKMCFTPVVSNNTPVLESRRIHQSDNEYAGLDTYVVIYDNKPDDVYKNGFIKFNHEEYRLEKYENVRYINKKTGTVEIGDFVCTDEFIGTNDSHGNFKMYIYEVGVEGNRFVIPNETPTIFSNLFKRSVYSDDTPLYGEECGLRAQPVFVYPNNKKEKYSLTANFDAVVGGVNKPSYQIHFDTDKYKNTLGMQNNLTTFADKIPTGVSYGGYYKVCYLYDVNKDGSMGGFVEDCYTDGDFSNSVGKSVTFFSDNNTYQYTVISYDRKTRIAKIGNKNKYSEYVRYYVEITNKTKNIETMYFNHFVRVYPIYDGVVDENNPTIETTTMYCDNLELVQFADSVPYLVSYTRKGELKEQPQNENDIADLDCSVFAKILCYNKHTHLITVNNPIVFADANTPRNLVVAYQNTTPFNRPKSIVVTVDDKPTREIVTELSEPYKNDSCDIKVYTDNEYVEYTEDVEYDEKKNKQHRVVDNTLASLTAKQKPEYRIFGFYEGDGNITIRVNGNTNYTAVRANGFFHFDFTDNVQSFEFTGGQKTITAVRFKNIKLAGGNGLFAKKILNGQVIQDFSNLKVVDGLVFPTNVWNVADFNNCGSLLYVNTAAFDFKITTDNYRDGYGVYYLLADKKNIENLILNIEFDESLPPTVKMNLGGMFRNCESLENLRINFKNRTVSVTSLASTFQNCKRLRNLDLSGIDFSELTSASAAFDGCTRLENIFVDWGENNVITNANNMFRNCRKLKTYGKFDGWKSSGIKANGMFMGCLSVDNVDVLFDVADNAAKDIFTNCEATSIGLKPSVYMSGELKMPYLTTVNTFGGFKFEHTFNMNTPNLTRSSWQKIISKSTVTVESTTIHIHNNVFKHLLKNVDYVENNGCYYVTDKPNIRIVPQTF